MNDKNTKMLPPLPDESSSDAALTAVTAVLCAMAVYYYGIRALIVTVVCAGVCIAADVFCLVLSKKALHIHDLSSLITGLSIACMLPASVPYTVAAAASLFAICIAKHPLGGKECQVVCPAAAGYIFAELSFPEAVLNYPKPFGELPAANIVNVPLFRSPAGELVTGSGAKYSDLELMTGNFPGAMGASVTAVVIVCAAVLLLLGAIQRWVFVTQLCCVLCYAQLVGGISAVKNTLTCGMFIFTLSVLSGSGYKPKKAFSGILFGLVSGALIIIISKISSLENPAVYACVIASPFAFAADKAADSVCGSLRKKRSEVEKSGGQQQE